MSWSPRQGMLAPIPGCGSTAFPAREGAKAQPEPRPRALLGTFLPEEVLPWGPAAGACTAHSSGGIPGTGPALSPSLPCRQVTNMITPVLSYSYMAVLVPVFLLTDYLRYKPVLVLQSLSHISIWLLLVLGTSVLAMQLMEFFYGITMAARIAYSSYIFSLVAPSRYQRMASYSRSAVLLGVFTSSVLGQLCVTLGDVRFLTLNYVSLGFVSFGLILTLFLERPRRSLFFNRPGVAGEVASPSELDRMAGGDSGGGTRGWQDMVLCRMLRELGALARQPQLRLWSLWWVFNSVGYYLLLYYAHILWNEISPTTDSRRVYNGGVDAASTLLGELAWGGDTPILLRPVGMDGWGHQRGGGSLLSRCTPWEWWSLWNFRWFGIGDDVMITGLGPSLGRAGDP